ncbi:MAG: acyltransferase domain-containing protein, partial [Proteobacteria bacterium]|nr:acyltransferase domain-containing protein [Pseudomonadota bacterium]
MGTAEQRRTNETIGVIVSNIAGRLDTGIAIAGVRCGAKGLLNLESASLAQATQAIARVQKFAQGPFGVRLDAASPDADTLLARLPAAVEFVVVSGASEKAARLKTLATAAHKTARQVFLEVTSARQAASAAKAGFDAVLARGTSEESSFSLLPAVLAEAKVPVWVAGGVGLHTAAGFWLAGAEGVLLDSQLLLTPQSGFSGDPGPFGPDAALAAPLAQHYANVAGIVNGIRVETHRHLEAAAKLDNLAAASTADHLAAADPASLKSALAGGARAFLLDGGLLHWESMITALYLAIDKGAPAAEMTAVFAGGIASATQAAMVAAMAAPLSARGMRVALKIDAPNAGELLAEASQIVKAGGAPAPPAATTWEQKPCDIAIVGMSCLLPKSPDIPSLWRNLLNRVDAIDEIPGHRFDYNLYFDPDKKTRDKIYSKWGGFLDPVPFDPMRYGIPPASLNSIDPMQLLALVGVENALRDAGYDRREFNRERTSVILGISGGLGEMGVDYAFRSNLPLYVDKAPEEVLRQVPEWTEDSFAGLLPNVAAGRVANRFNFGGANFIVDAACASSLTAVYVAARELNSGACDTVVVGGVDATQNAFGFLCFSKAQALSPRGRCRPFDSSADGIAIAEGVTMLVLKRLSDAERDGDRIYAVIKGIAASSDGKGRSMTAPRLEGQILALRRAYAQAGVDSSTIGLIEAHGTGTTLGDTTEIGALDTVFRADKAAPHSCAVGSIKSMVGHTKSAAGATSLMKVALALHHKVLPPTLHVETQNPKLREDGTPFFVCNEPQPFLPPAPGVPRRAGISSFGFGGTNFHALVEEYQGDYSEPADHALTDVWPAELFLFTAENAPALTASLTLLETALGRQHPPALRDLAFSVSSLAAWAGDTGLRLAIVAGSHRELSDRIAAAKQALADGKTKLSDNKGLFLAPAGKPGKLAFLFPGQGSQYPNMLHDLALNFAEFRHSLERADTVLAGKYPSRISSLLYPPTGFTDGDKTAQMQAITDTVVAQPALGIVEIALARLLQRLGINPDMTAGHSYGEYVALAAAGVMDDDELFRLSEARGRAIKDTVGADSGTMAAVSADAASVQQALEGIDVVLANYNSPKQTIIAGATKAVEQALERLKERKLAARGIPVACAFHSPLMRGAAAVLDAHLKAATFSQPTAAVYSNLLAEPYPSGIAEISALLTAHLTSPVKFTDQIRRMYDDGARIFLEVGPKGVLSGLTRQILDGKDVAIIQTETSAEKPGIPQWLNSLAQLMVNGVAFDVAQLFRGRGAQKLDLTHLPAEAARPGWAMNPSRVFPVGKQPQIRSTPVQLVKPSDAPPKVIETIVEKVVEKVVERPVPVPVAGAPAAAPAAAGAMDAVLMQFQSMMGQFLQTQSAVLSAYLQGGAPVAPAAPLPAMPLPVPVASAAAPLQAPPPIMAPPPVMAPPPGMAKPAAAVAPPPAPVAAAPAAPPAPPAPVAAPAGRDAAAELLQIAAERTGYPADMLDLNSGIESDLGIDSIKRVEILTGFQKRCTPDQQAAVQAIMDKLTSARTLKEIIERLTAVLGSAP